MISNSQEGEPQRQVGSEIVMMTTKGEVLWDDHGKSWKIGMKKWLRKVSGICRFVDGNVWKCMEIWFCKKGFYGQCDKTESGHVRFLET